MIQFRGGGELNLAEVMSPRDGRREYVDINSDVH